eukprot:Gb_40519 [translate_table: standard]
MLLSTGRLLSSSRNFLKALQLSQAEIKHRWIAHVQVAIRESANGKTAISEGAETSVLYVRFKAAANEMKPLMEEIESRSSRKEYAQILADCHTLYCEQRLSLVKGIVHHRISEYAKKEPLSSLTRSGCAYLMQGDEIFSIASSCHGHINGADVCIDAKRKKKSVDIQDIRRSFKILGFLNKPEHFLDLFLLWRFEMDVLSMQLCAELNKVGKEHLLFPLDGSHEVERERKRMDSPNLGLRGDGGAEADTK